MLKRQEGYKMKVLVQRVLKASCTVDGKITGKIDNGLLLFVGFCENDNIERIKYLVKKIINLRIMNDSDNIMNKSVLDTKGSILSISQFTLYAVTKKGNRPSYINALASVDAKILYDMFNEELSKYIKVEKGIFGADMKISLVNDGPVTIMLER